MRAWEYNSYLDNEGKPLIGRFTFYKANTEILATIYDAEGNVIDNPVLSNTIGQPQIQVFLPNEDITIVVEKATEYDTFEFQYSFIDKYKVFSVVLEAGGFPIVQTIDDLRNTDPAEIEANYGFREVILAGYNAYGDKPSVHYKWIANLVAADNGGNIIAGNTTEYGRWQLVVDSLDVVDVRHFGVFGKRIYSDTNNTMAAQINVAANYADQIGKALFFPDIFIDSVSVYRVYNATITAQFADNVELYSTGGTSYITIEGDGLPKINANNVGTYYITGKVLKTSMVASNSSVSNIHFTPTERLIWDKNIAVNVANSYSYSNIIVEFQTTTQNTTWTLNNCEIISDHYIQGKAHTFIACEIKESYFASGITKNQLNYMTFTNCSSEPYYWTKFDLFVLYMTKQGYNDIDFKGKSFSLSADVGIDKSITIRNVTISGSYGFLLYANNIKFHDSTVWINGNNSVWNYTVYFYNCNVQGTVDNDVYSVYAYNTVFGSKWACAGKSVFDRCTVSQSLYLGPYANVIGCDISQPIYLYPASTQQMWFTLKDNNITNGTFQIINRTVNSTVLDMHSIVVQQAWIMDNKANGTRLITFDKANMASSQGWYLYRNNVADGNSPVKDIQLTVIDNTDGNGSQRSTGVPELWVENSSFGTSIHNVKLSDVIFSFGEDNATRPTKYRIQVIEDQFNTLGTSHLATAWCPTIPHSTGYYMILMNGMSSNQYGPSYYKNAILTEDHYKNVEINLGTNGDGGDNYTVGNAYTFRFIVEEISN